MAYLNNKGFEHAGHQPKVPRQRFLTQAQIKAILDAVQKSENKFKQRDFALIFFGYYLGLRVGEVVMLSRDTFRDADEGLVYVRTLKAAPRVPHTCKECGRRCRVAVSRHNTELQCANCGHKNVVHVPQNLREKEVNPEKTPPAVETKVLEFAQDYLKNQMRPDQFWLFESPSTDPKLRGKFHIATSYARRIFNTYVQAAGLDPEFSWHSLRHGRGVFVYERFNDVQQVREMLRQKSLGAAEIYIHMSPARAQKLRDALEREGEDE